ncbi:MAG: AAA family ATPase [Burkholderiaceae bacterium]
MYAEFFGLKQDPFTIAPDPRYLFMSERHREALAHLLYGIRGGGGFVLLSGEIGAGKTTICRCFLEQIPDNCRVAYIFNPKLTVGDLLKTICHEFHIEVKHDGPLPATIKDYLDPLNEYLLRSHAAGEHNLLIVDEAQNLTPHVLEQLRLLTNLETSERKLLQIVLIGQPELRQILARPDMEQLAQRVIARFHLAALSEAETRQYIQHRLEVAGLRGPTPFGDDALKRIHTLARGVPRRINLLCDRALLGAYATGRSKVDAAIVEKAATEVFEQPDVEPTPAARATGPAWLRSAGTLGLGALGGALVAALLYVWWPRPESVPSQAPSKVGQAATPSVAPPAGGPAADGVRTAAPITGAPEPRTPEAPRPEPGLPDAEALWTDNGAAWRQLATLWGVRLGDGDACDQGLAQQLQCFRIFRMTVHGLRLLDRPALLQIELPGQPAGWAILTAMTGETATLRAGDRHWQVPLTALADIWHGDYATLWRQPPGQQGRISNALGSASGDWALARLRQLQRDGQLDTTAQDNDRLLMAFQQAHGIEPHGRASPMTFMMVNLVTGVAEPRLSSSQL